MDVMELFRQVAQLFIKFWSIRMTIGGHTVTVGAVVIFVLAVGLIVSFMRGVSD